jgi:hypothetical protein
MATQTRTYALLPVSQATFDEIKAKLERAGYSEQLIKPRDGGGLRIDMNGLALVVEEPQT